MGCVSGYGVGAGAGVPAATASSRRFCCAPTAAVLASMAPLRASSAASPAEPWPISVTAASTEVASAVTAAVLAATEVARLSSEVDMVVMAKAR